MQITSLYKELGIKINHISCSEKTICIEFHSICKRCLCPYCGKVSKKVHSRYQRTLHDLPILTRQVILIYNCRKFFCYNPTCLKKTFSEQGCLEIKRYSRRTGRLTRYLQNLLVSSTSTIQVSKLCKTLNLQISPSTGLRILYKTPLPEIGQIEQLGIDDWAYRKGCNYGSILIDLAKSRIIDILPDRESKSFQNWLEKHPEVKWVSRDRSSEYSTAIAKVRNTHSIKEVADRFHLIKNIFDHVGKYIRKNYKELVEIPVALKPTIELPLQEQMVSDSRHVLFEEVKKLQQQGYKINTAAKKLSIARQTVRKYFKYEQLPKVAIKTRNKYYQIDSFVQNQYYKGKSLNQIYIEVKKNGFKAGRSPFYYHYKYLSRQGKEESPQNVNSFVPPKLITTMLIKQVTGKTLNQEDQKYFNHFIKIRWFDQLYQATSAFYKIIMGDKVEPLKQWMQDVKTYDIPEMNTFIKGLEMDKEAVLNAIKYNMSNGIVEGFVNKLKTFKRNMYGRASFELLKRKLILSQLIDFN